MSVSIIPPPEDELLKAALDLLRVKEGTPARQSARLKVEQLCAEFNDALDEAAASPLIAETRKALNKLADDATALAKRKQIDDDRFMLGAATFSWSDTPDQKAAKRKEIDDFRDAFLPVAKELTRISNIIRERISQWDGKTTGELHVYEMVYGAPKKQLARSAAKLFCHYRPNDLNAGRKSDFYIFLERLFELATGRESNEDELLRHAREAVNAIRDYQ